MHGKTALAVQQWIGLAGLLVGLSAVPALGQPGAEAVYLLGRASETEGDTTRALHVWQQGLDSLGAAGQIDVRLSDAYVRAVFRSEAEAAYPRAARIYLDLIEIAETFTAEAEQRLVERHVAQMLTLWPEAERPRLVEEGKAKKGRLRLMPGAGATIAAWWRGQDLELATQRNERLEEHLLRVAQAEDRYRYDEALTGYDDRGAIFVRLGKPDQHEVITFQEGKLLEIFTESLSGITLADLPKNEVWYYPSLDRSGLYVFIRKSGRYQLALPSALIPARLRVVGPKRGQLKLVALMQYLNLELGRINPHYNSRYAGGVNDILLYRRLNRWTMVAPASGGRLETMLFGAVHDIERDDADEIRDREDHIPQQDSQLFDDLDVLPVAFRFARFLDDDGTTRTELFWSHPPDTVLTEDRFVQLTTVQKQADYRTRSWMTNRYAPNKEELDGGAYVHTRTLHGDTARYHLHLQWELYDKASGRRRRVNVFKADSLDALNPDPARLEMSDLMPSLDLDPERLDTPDSSGLAIRPYPLPNVAFGTVLALYFEAYHLTFGPDDLTHYTVEFEIARREKGGLWRLFRPKEERTAVVTSYTGTSRTASEYVIVDLIEEDKAIHLKVTVRIIDDTTGQQVERSIEFDFAQK